MPYSPKMQQTFFDLIDDALSYIHALAPKKASLPLREKRKPQREMTESRAPLKQEIPETIPLKPVEKGPKQTESPTKSASPSSSFPLFPPPLPPLPSFIELRQIFESLAQKIPIQETIPSDAIAKERQTNWQMKKHAPLVALFIHDPSLLPFFTNVAKAITCLFGKATIFDPTAMEKENQWQQLLETPSLKLVIASDTELFHAKSLLEHYREKPTDRLRFLGNIPLLLLPHPTLYFKDPLLKKSLWNLIKKHLL